MYNIISHETKEQHPPAGKLKIHEEVFIATALLHRENPAQGAFSVKEIVDRVGQLNLTGELRRGVKTYVYRHCVANLPPDPGGYRTLYKTADDQRRLLLVDDDVDPQRKGSIFPEPESLPPQFVDLVAWAKQRYKNGGGQQRRWLDGVLNMAGMGRELWKGEDPDAYVRRLREGWE